MNAFLDANGDGKDGFIALRENFRLITPLYARRLSPRLVTQAKNQSY